MKATKFHLHYGDVVVCKYKTDEYGLPVTNMQQTVAFFNNFAKQLPEDIPVFLMPDTINIDAIGVEKARLFVERAAKSIGGTVEWK